MTTYAEIRGRLKTGDVLLCAGRGIVSAGIAAVTDSPWTHAALIRVDHGRVMVFEAVGSGVRYYPMSRLIDRREPDGGPHYTRFLALRPCDHVPSTVVSACLDAVGAPYAHDQIGRLWWQSYFGGTTPEDESPERFICSALASWAWREAGLDLLPDISDLDTTPAMLATIDAAWSAEFVNGDDHER